MYFNAYNPVGTYPRAGRLQFHLSDVTIRYGPYATSMQFSNRCVLVVLKVFVLKFLVVYIGNALPAVGYKNVFDRLSFIEFL